MRHPQAVKDLAMERYLSEGTGYRVLSAELGVARSTLKEWLKGMPRKAVVRDHLEGQTFGTLTVLEESGRIGRNVSWLCECRCGEKKIATSAGLQAGRIASCGKSGCKERKALLKRPKSAAIEAMLKEVDWLDTKFIAEAIGSNMGSAYGLLRKIGAESRKTQGRVREWRLRGKTAGEIQ